MAPVNKPTFLSLIKAGMVLSVGLASGIVQGQVINESFWVTNGPVYTMTRSESSLFLGGKFTYVGPPTGSGLLTGGDTGTLDDRMPVVNGLIRCVVPDGTGGWYLGGDFTKIGGLPRNRLAHLFSDLSVDPAWNPDSDGAVYSLLVSGQDLIIGGAFTFLGGLSRAYLGSVSLTTGTVTSWTPAPTGSVYALAQNSVHLFAGGNFTSIAGESRSYLASFVRSTGALTAWKPNPNNRVRCLLNPYNDDNYLLAGGEFTTVAGQNRSYLTMLYSTADLTTTWFNPTANSSVYALCPGPSGTVFAAGYFTTIGGQTRNYVAKLELYNGLATAWNGLITSGYALCLATDGTKVYAGGSFSYAGNPSVMRNNAVSFDVTSATVTTWNPNPFGQVYSLAATGGQVMIGGSFSGAGGIPRNNAAALDLLTGEATGWNPDVSYSVNSLTLLGNTVYLGGSFTQVGGQNRRYLASVSSETGAVSSWNPSANGIVRCIYSGPAGILAGGDFTTVGGLSRSKLAAIDPGTGAVTAWDPNVNGTVYSLVSDGISVFAGGSFSSVGGTTRNGLAEINSEGTVTGWNPSITASRIVYALILRGELIYAGGTFTTVGGQIRNRIAAINKTTGVPDAWNPNANGEVRCLYPGTSVIFAGGAFSRIGGAGQARLAGLDPATGTSVSWVPATNDVVYALEAAGSGLYAGGEFTQFGGESKSYFGLVYDENTLPVELTGFSASVSFPEVHLRWETVSEKNNYGFEIQFRDAAGQEPWQTAGFVPGKGTTTRPTAYHYAHSPGWRSGMVCYRLVQKDTDGNSLCSQPLTVVSQEAGFSLSPAFPNPFNPETSIRFSLAKAGPVKITLTDLTGRELKVLQQGQQPAGSQTLRVSGDGLASGVYFIRVEAGNRSKLQKIVVLK
ncbi:MAG: T9SS type A sorting domain-containing protein [Bacteroidetes bacterium]|nr:T9SS type A sorting domain-containing protein [Bacteroidota bacterium]